MNSNTGNLGNTGNSGNTFVAPEDIKITIIDDSRCTNCYTKEITESLKQVPSIMNIENFETKDFTDEGVQDFLKENNITALPAIIFSTNNFDTSLDPSIDSQGRAIPKINSQLQKLKSGDYHLNTQASFDPFTTRSDKGYLIIEPLCVASSILNRFLFGSHPSLIALSQLLPSGLSPNKTL